jgi:hypothetical protein
VRLLVCSLQDKVGHRQVKDVISCWRIGDGIGRYIRKQVALLARSVDTFESVAVHAEMVDDRPKDVRSDVLSHDVSSRLLKMLRAPTGVAPKLHSEI